MLYLKYIKYTNGTNKDQLLIKKLVKLTGCVMVYLQSVRKVTHNHIPQHSLEFIIRNSDVSVVQCGM